MKSLKKLPKTLLISSILINLNACHSIPIKKKLPKPEICILNSVKRTVSCYDESNGKSRTISIIDAHRFVCSPPKRFEDLLNYIKGAYKPTKKGD